ncbi:MAG: hypothetical protein ACUVWR_15505 [Anaerolineae bacterium]
MRTLSSPLLSAQQSQTVRPYVQVMVDDRHVGVGRLRPQAIYQGSEAGGPCAMVASDGYILRAWTNSVGELRLCRAQAGSSGWGDWTLLATGVSTQAQMALASAASDAYLLYVTDDGASLLCRRSQDGGQSWAAAETAFQAESGCRILAIAAVCASAHECICLVGDDAQGSGADDMVHVAWRRQGQWSSATWPRDAGDGLAGLAAISLNGQESYSSVHFALCGAFEDTSRPAVRLYHLQLTADGQRLWTHRGPALLGEAPDFTWAWPALVVATGDRPRLFLLQRTPQGDRLGHIFLMRLGLTGPVAAGDFLPLNGQAAQGVGAAACGQDLYWGSAANVWRSPVYSGAADQRVDASADVVSYSGRSWHRGLATSPDDLALLLDNSSGKYDAEAATALRLGGQVSLREGYHTSSGAEVAYQAPYWIAEIERLQVGGAGKQVLLRCYDGWGKLWRSYSDRVHEWQCSPAAVLTEALEHCGFVYSDDGSDSLYCAATPPRFSLAGGQPWGSLVVAVLDYCGCELRFFVNPEEEATWPSARAHVFTATDEPCYSYGADEHPILESALSEREPGGTWAQVYGDGVYGEALNLEAMAELGFVSVRQVLDPRLHEDTDVTAAQAAAFALRRYSWSGQGGWLLLRPNVGQELLDVVSVSLGSTVTRRVLAIERRYDRRGGIYRQRLLLAKL